MTNESFADRDGWIWMDGRMVAWREAQLHVLTHGLHYASSVFEGERAYSGRIFALAEHSARLIGSAGLLGFRLAHSAAEIDAACRLVVAESGLQDAYVRPIAWRGSEALSIGGASAVGHLAIACWAWPNLFGEARAAGLRLCVSRWRRPDPATAPTASKASGLYMISTLARQEAEAAGFDDALMLDWRGRVAEGTGANVFLVIDGALHTPRPEGFLDGITRRVVMGLARARQIEVVEREIAVADLDRASEVFLAGTAAEVTPVRQIEGRGYAMGGIGALLAADYEALVRSTGGESELLAA